MNISIEKSLQLTKKASKELLQVRGYKKKKLLMEIAQCLRANETRIMKANNRDVSQATNGGFTRAFLDRLTLSEKVFNGMINQLEAVAQLDDVLGEIIEQKILENAVLLQKKRFPLGVIAMIYESRPNVTIDAMALCLKAGNAVILKGGSEALQTNRELVKCVHDVLERFSISLHAVTFLELTHSDIEYVLTRNDLIDVVIPRGSYQLTTTVAEKSRIPVLYHAAGGACMYIDKSARLDIALDVCVNSKTNKFGVCNALDLVIVHEQIAQEFLEKLDTLLYEKKCEIRADTKSKHYMKHSHLATSEDYVTEFLDNILAVKTVSSVKQALHFVAQRTHGHTEVIISEDTHTVDQFIATVDAAGIMVNCSSRLHDGGEFGMGAEMGTATGKLHARGPVGLRELTTYKWIAYGKGQTKCK